VATQLRRDLQLVALFLQRDLVEASQLMCQQLALLQQLLGLAGLVQKAVKALYYTFLVSQDF
jgi:hypothetical protein